MKSYLKGLRFAAFLIDALLVTVFILILGNLSCAFFLKVFPQFPYVIYISWTLFVILGVGYILFKDGFKGRSLGKKIMGLIVRKENERPCNFSSSFLRNFTLFLPLINFYEFYLFLKGHNNPRLGEKISKTKIEET